MHLITHKKKQETESQKEKRVVGKQRGGFFFSFFFFFLSYTGNSKVADIHPASGSSICLYYTHTFPLHRWTHTLHSTLQSSGSRLKALSRLILVILQPQNSFWETQTYTYTLVSAVLTKEYNQSSNTSPKFASEVWHKMLHFPLCESISFFLFSFF